MGIYGRNSFRGSQLGFRDRYFTQQGSDYHLAEYVKRTVRFHCENLLNPNLFLEQRPYHVIFCRNVLIYFHESAKQQVMQTLDRLLIEAGLLFLGCAETVLVPPNRFTAIRYPSAFAFRKQSAVGSALTGQSSNSPSSKLPSPIHKGHKGYPSVVSHHPIVPQPPSTPPSLSSRSVSSPRLPSPGALRPIIATNLPAEATISNDLATAQQLADRGNLIEATHLCETYLKQNCTDVAAQVLLGQVYQAQGREQEAEVCFQRAIFLDPKHTEALVHLALLKEQQGDTRSTALLWQRVQRSSSEPNPSH
jgi:chemotaxis protein methyltransferase WspC